MDDMEHNMQPVPRDSRVVQDILESLNIEEYDGRIVDQLLNFMHGYTSEVLQDAQEIAGQGKSGDGVVGTNDVAIALRLKTHHSFVTAPPMEDLARLSAQVNKEEIPEIKVRHGLRIPPESQCLLTPNYQLPKRNRGVFRGNKFKSNEPGASLANKNHTIDIKINPSPS
eukprot:jgi/Picsp_1/1669/NSC_05143-R1_saga complex transcription initiation factor taf9